MRSAAGGSGTPYGSRRIPVRPVYTGREAAATGVRRPSVLPASGLWRHAYRSEDDITHGLLMQQPSLFYRDGWAERLPVAETGETRFGNGLNRDQITNIRLPLETVLDYAEAVGRAVQSYADSLSEEDGAELVPTPFFQPTYPMLDRMSRAEIISFFSIGHVAEHLGEVQYIKGLMGLQGAPM